MATRVGLLGPPVIHLRDDRLQPPPGKTSAMLLYLAYSVRWTNRTELVELFWPDVPERTARTNLRSLLRRSLPTRRYAAGVEIEPTRVRWMVPSDVAEFRAAAGEARHSEVFRLHRGPLLEGFVLDGAPVFEAWLAAERADLHNIWRESALSLCEQLEASDQWAQAVGVLDRLQAADPYDEAVLRRLLTCLAEAGRLRRAREMFDGFSHWLASEVGAEPEPATSALAASISSGDRARNASPDALDAERGSNVRRSVGRLPTPPGEIVGRTDERARLTELLAGGSAHLVTLTGPGGIGKTRLALAVAQDLSSAEPGPAAFPDGVCFSSCEQAVTTDDLLTALADALDLPLTGLEEPRNQLLHYLAEKYVLLVIDNLEQLRGRLAVLDELLECAPGLRILATSRKLLGSRFEQVVDLTGMNCPPVENRALGTFDRRTRIDDSVVDELAAYEALALFAGCGRRVQADFAITGDNVLTVARICRLVAGLPLAIELAANWLRALTPDEIAAELTRGLDILAAASPSEGDRHASLRAVFDSTWSALSARERRVLARLSVFAGGFDLEAARSVAHATVADVGGLVNNSLLAMTALGRYRLHPLIHLYARERLADEATASHEAKALAEAHCAYFTEFLSSRTKALLGGDQLTAANEIAAEIDNVRLAWNRAVANIDSGALARQAPALSPYFIYGSRYHEMLTAFRAAARRLREEPQGDGGSFLGFVLTTLGWCNMRLGNYQEATALLHESLALGGTSASNRDYPASDPRLPLGLMAVGREDYSTAVEHGQGALKLSKKTGHSNNERIAQYVLARAANAQGKFELGERHARQALAACELAGDRWFMSDCLLELGDAAFGQGRADVAKRRYTRAKAICREFDNRAGAADAINRLAGLALNRRDYSEARRLYADSLAAGEAVSDGREIARAECGLGDALAGLAEPGKAVVHYRRSLRRAFALRSWPLVLRVASGSFALVPGSERDSHLRDLRTRRRSAATFGAVVNEVEVALTSVEFD